MMAADVVFKKKNDVFRCVITEKPHVFTGDTL